MPKTVELHTTFISFEGKELKKTAKFRKFFKQASNYHLEDEKTTILSAIVPRVTTQCIFLEPKHFNKLGKEHAFEGMTLVVEKEGKVHLVYADASKIY